MNSRTSRPRAVRCPRGSLRTCRVLAAAIAVSASLSGTATAAPFVVAQGFDLLETLGGTTFMGFPFTGVPLGGFDFGSGAVGTGVADTIVQRLGAASSAPPQNPGGPFRGLFDDLSGGNVIPIELVALQLRSATPIDLGAGTAYHYITLNTGGPASTGFARINFNGDGSGGTFDSFFDVFFDLRIGTVNGPILLTSQKHFVSTAGRWSRGTDPLRAPLFPVIPGVNHHLNGSNTDEDFQVASATHFNPDAIHAVGGAGVPEPSVLVLLGLGIVALARRHAGRR